MNPFETAILSGWAMANCLALAFALITMLRVYHFETVLTSSFKLARLRRDRATAITLTGIIVCFDLLLWLNNPSIPAANL